MEDTNCRNCGKKLTGKYPYFIDPVSKKEAKINYYGGAVCSRQCDFDACLELERSMPGHGYSQKTLGQSSYRKVNSNWGY